MALVPRIKPCFRDNCKTLRILETTGIYDVDTNEGGWGTPNTTLVLADPVTLTITLADEETSEEFDLTATVNAATIIDGEFLLDNLTMADFGGSSTDQFDDGIINLVYVVTDSDTETEYTYDINIWNDCKVKCCLSKLLTKIQEELCGCGFTTFWNNYNLLSMNISAAAYAFGQGNTTAAKKFLKQAQNTCLSLQCKC